MDRKNMILLKYFYSALNVPLTYIDENIKFRLGTEFDDSLAEKLIDKLLEGTKNPELLVSDDFLICGIVSCRDTLFFLGPVMEFPCNIKTARGILKQFEEPFSKTDSLISYFEAVPHINIGKFLKYLLFLHYLVCGEEPAESWKQSLKSKAKSFVNPPENLSTTPVHNSSVFEKELLSCIEFGKLNELIDILKNESYIDANMGIMANDSLRAYKNMFTVSVALVSRAAVRGGMDYETAMRASDIYLCRMEELSKWDDLRALWHQMLIDYTEYTKKCRSLNTESILARQVNNYIFKNIFKKISVSDIARDFGYNSSYLCRKFREDTGKRLSDCINEVKIEEAKKLLSHTNKQVSEISSLLGYSTQSYFQTVFKKLTGITPVQYKRNKYCEIYIPINNIQIQKYTF